MRVLLQLRLPPRPPTPASPLVPAAAIDSATGAALASAYHLPPLLSPDSASAVALRASILEEVRSVVRDTLTTSSPRPLRRSAGLGAETVVRRRSKVPGPRVLSVIAHRGEQAPWSGWSPSPTRPTRTPAVPVSPLDSGDCVSSAGCDQSALPLPQPVPLRPSAPPPSPNHRPAAGWAQHRAEERQSSHLVSAKWPRSDRQPQAAPRLRMQEPTAEGHRADKQHGRRKRPASTERVGLDRPSGWDTAVAKPGAFARARSLQFASIVKKTIFCLFVCHYNGCAAHICL
jgi:hypothetical protein